MPRSLEAPGLLLWRLFLCGAMTIDTEPGAIATAFNYRYWFREVSARLSLPVLYPCLISETQCNEEVAPTNLEAEKTCLGVY